MLTWGLDRLSLRLLEERDVTRAHIAAPHVLAAWQALDAPYWRNAFLNLFVGAIVPLLGCLTLGWSPALVVLALTADVVMLWLCDALKGVLAPTRMKEERAHQEEAAEVLAVIRALDQPRRPLHDRLRGSPSARALYLSVPSVAATRNEEKDRLIVILYTLAFFALFGIGAVTIVPEAAFWLLAGVALRLAVSVMRTLAAGRHAGPRPELLNESGIPSLALLLVLYPVSLLIQHYEFDFIAIGAQRLALVTLGLYVLSSGSLAFLGLRRVRFATAALGAFIARNREQLKERVRQING